MFNIIPLILILLSFLVIIFIVLKKFSVLANLDVNTIQSEREEKFKKRIISNRIKRNALKHYMRVVGALKPLMESVSEIVKNKYDNLLKAKEEYSKKEVGSGSINEVDKLFLEFEELEKNENWVECEKKLIEIISLDSKNLKAFKELGNIYFVRKDYSEARQTFEHAIKLFEKEEKDCIDNVKLSDIYFELSSVARSMDSLDKAVASLDKALEIEPNNPRYLDTKLEISIIKKDKTEAEKTYQKFAEVNPENQKLEDLKKQIEALD